MARKDRTHWVARLGLIDDAIREHIMVWQWASSKPLLQFFREPTLSFTLTSFQASVLPQIISWGYLQNSSTNTLWNKRCKNLVRSCPFSESFSIRLAMPWQPIPLGIIERGGVPQAYVRARASSAALCSVHVLRVFLCIFFIKKGIWYVSKRAWIHIWYLSKPVPPVTVPPLWLFWGMGLNESGLVTSQSVEHFGANFGAFVSNFVCVCIFVKLPSAEVRC